MFTRRFDKGWLQVLQVKIGLVSLACVLFILSSGCQRTSFEKGEVEFLPLPSSSHTLAIDTQHGLVSVKSENRSDIKVEWKMWSWGFDAKRNLENSSFVTREEGGGQFRIRILLSNPGFQDSTLVLSVPEGVGLVIEAPNIAVQGSFSQVDLKAGSLSGKVETVRVDLTSKAELFRADLVFENLVMRGDADKVFIRLGSELPDLCNLILQTPLGGSTYDINVAGSVWLTIPPRATGKISAKAPNGVMKILVPVEGQTEANGHYFSGLLNGRYEDRLIQVNSSRDLTIQTTP